MQFGYTIIYVPDVEETISFYESAFNLKRLFISECKQYGELDTGFTKLAFVSEISMKSKEIRFIKNQRGKPFAGFEIAFVSKDVHSSYKNACGKGAVAVEAPVEKPWGQIVACVCDINGVLVEICSPINKK